MPSQEMTELEMLEARAARLRMELQAVELAVNALRAFENKDGAQPAHQDLPRSLKYHGMRLKDAIIDCLSKKEEEGIEPLTRELMAHGAYVGKDPRRYTTVVKIAVTQNPKDFSLKGDKVVLKQRRTA